MKLIRIVDNGVLKTVCPDCNKAMDPSTVHSFANVVLNCDNGKLYRLACYHGVIE